MGTQQQDALLGLTADVATAEVYDIYFDTDGAVWVRLDNDGKRWSYLIDGDVVSDDVRDVLPEDCEPYRPLDEYSSEFIRRHVRVVGRLGEYLTLEQYRRTCV